MAVTDSQMDDEIDLSKHEQKTGWAIRWMDGRLWLYSQNLADTTKGDLHSNVADDLNDLRKLKDTIGKFLRKEQYGT